MYNGNSIPIEITKNVNDVIITEDFIRVPYSKAIAQLALERVPKVKTKEIEYEKLLSIKSKRGTGKLGSTLK